VAENNTLLAVLELDSNPDLLISRATWIAKAFSLNVHIVLYEPDSGALLGSFSISHEADEIRERIHHAQAEIVEEYAVKLRSEGIEVSTAVLRLRPLGERILDIAAAVKPKLVLKSTTYHSAAERSIMVDSDWQLMRICPYPLWLVKADSMPDEPTIVAAVDPSNAHDKPAVLDREVVLSAQAVANAIGGNVELVHVYERLAGIGRAAIKALNPQVLQIDEIDARIRDQHRNALDKLAVACEIEPGRVHQLPGHTHEILPMFTRTRPTGLLVMGALARWGVKKMIIGSTTERVIDHVACDVLIVRLSEHQLYG
jgi:universal stress protein E